jgi:hypothetical protein
MSFANTGWSLLMRPYVGLPGTSSAVITHWTPERARAADVSIETILAYGCGERKVAPQSMFSACKSEVNSKLP